MTHLLGLPPLCAYVAFAISALFLVVQLGHSVLALLRDFDNYRADRERAKRRVSESPSPGPTRREARS
jgi:hypothetical protein